MSDSSLYTSTFALVTPDKPSRNPLNVNKYGYSGRVPLQVSEFFPSYSLYATEPMMGAMQKGKSLPYAACNNERSFDDLTSAKKACIDSTCCGGVTQTHPDGKYSLRAGQTPVPDKKARSWVKETAHGRTTNAGQASEDQLKSLQTTTLLSKAYFSTENQSILQNAIRRGVHQATQHIVDEQDHLQLQIVMRSVFLQYAKHDTSSVKIIKQQIAELNQKVIDYCVPIVISNVKQYLHYRKDISSLPVPMAYGLATSQAGSRSLELRPFV